MIIPVEYIISKGHFEVRDPLLKIKLAHHKHCMLFVDEAAW